MTFSLFGLLLLALLALYWLSATQAKEIARACARDLCAQANVQLLDQTVALIDVRPVKHEGALRIRRRYRFEYSADGIERQRGSITLMGEELESATVPRASHAEPGAP
jgi:Protein of unknown function (DUF3301)